MRQRYRFLVILALFAAVNALSALAVTNRWVGGDGTWNDTAKWSAAAVPDTSDRVYLTNTVGDIVVSYTNTANPTLGYLRIEGTNGASVTVTQSQDYLTVTGHVYLACGGGTKATFTQTGGINIFGIGWPDVFYITYDEKSTGVYRLVNGFLAAGGNLGGLATSVKVGCNGDGTFIQDGGRFQGDTNSATTNANYRDFDVGGVKNYNYPRTTGGRGKSYLNGGIFCFRGLYIGCIEGGEGLFQQNGGTNLMSQRIYVGNYGTGRYELNGGFCQASGGNGPTAIGRNGGRGTLTMTGGTFEDRSYQNVANRMCIGSGTNDSGVAAYGEVNIFGGDFYSYSLFVGGDQATGVVNHTGGTVAIGSDSASVAYGMMLGSTNYGYGLYNFGNTVTSGVITNWSTYGRYLTVRKYADTRGVFQGWGEVYLSGTLINNGVVITDGYGTNRTLNFSRFSTVSNLIENGVSETNGWYARNRGKLTLPAITVPTGNSTNNWGEQGDDAALDLVNSARMVFTNVTVGGVLTKSLVATDRADIPALPATGKCIGLWEFRAGAALTLTSMTVTFRYDETLRPQRINELALYRHNGTTWAKLSEIVDTANRLITATVTTVGVLEYYAVCAPDGTIVSFH
ncbi:MAG: hypothetical protein Q8O57_05585 [Kiritimatiellota bacterium]|nr:hypothetical protein [Kiritimatiellota bacterium]